MVALELLEQKFLALVALVNDLKETKDRLTEQNDLLKQELTAARFDNENLAFECLQLSSKIEMIGQDNTNEVDQLQQERERTKAVVENLIKDIDSLVVKEQQL